MTYQTVREPFAAHLFRRDSAMGIRVRPVIDSAFGEEREYLVNVFVLHHTEDDAEETVVRLRGIVTCCSVVMELNEGSYIGTDAMGIMTRVAENKGFGSELLPTAL